MTTNVNYGAWGSDVSVAPLSGFKVSVYEGGIRAPFIFKEPSSMAATAGQTTTTNATKLQLS